MVVIVAPPVTLVKLFVSSGTSRAINTRHHPCNSHSTAFQLFVKALYFLALTLASSIAQFLCSRLNRRLANNLQRVAYLVNPYASHYGTRLGAVTYTRVLTSLSLTVVCSSDGASLTAFAVHCQPVVKEWRCLCCLLASTIAGRLTVGSYPTWLDVLSLALAAVL
jgi:hypothetical protein